MTWLQSDPGLRDRLEGLTFDTNRLVGPTPRKFLLAVYAETGAWLSVLPTVQREFRSAAAAYDVRFASRTIAGLRAQGQEFGAEREASILSKVSALAGAGFVEKLMSTEVCRFIEPAPGERAKTEALVAQLPDGCFRGKNAAADKRIVAETVVHGMNGIVTADVRSIDHHGVNRWARDAGVSCGREGDLILDTDTAFRTLCEGRDAKQALLWWATAAALPGVARDDEGSVRRFATQLARSGFNFVNAQLVQALDEERSHSTFFAQVRAKRSKASWQIEEERRHMVRQAARDACLGW